LRWEEVERNFDDAPLLGFVENSSFRRGMPVDNIFEDPARAAVLESVVVNEVLRDTSGLEEDALRTCHAGGCIHAVQQNAVTICVPYLIEIHLSDPETDLLTLNLVV